MLQGAGGLLCPLYQVQEQAAGARYPPGRGGGQSDEAVRLEMAELLGRVVGDRGEGVGGKIVKVLNGRGEYFQPKIVKHIFYQH